MIFGLTRLLSRQKRQLRRVDIQFRTGLIYSYVIFHSRGWIIAYALRYFRPHHVSPLKVGAGLRVRVRLVFRVMARVMHMDSSVQ